MTTCLSQTSFHHLKKRSRENYVFRDYKNTIFFLSVEDAEGICLTTNTLAGAERAHERKRARERGSEIAGKQESESCRRAWGRGCLLGPRRRSLSGARGEDGCTKRKREIEHAEVDNSKKQKKVDASEGGGAPADQRAERVDAAAKRKPAPKLRKTVNAMIAAKTSQSTKVDAMEVGAPAAQGAGRGRPKLRKTINAMIAAKTLQNSATESQAFMAGFS
jgi:hypothetical protein